MDTGWRNLAIALVTVTLLISTGLGALSIVETAGAGHETCVQVNALRIALTQILDQSARALPSNSYYKHHLTDLRAAEQQIHYDLSLFRPVVC